MNKVWATLQTLGILLALWVILAAVGLIAGVIPLDGFGPPAASDAPPAEVADAGGLADAGAALDDAGALADAGVTAAAPAALDALPRWQVCASTAEPSLTVAQLFGGAAPELIVGCGDRWEVIATGARGPARIATFTAPPAPSGQVASAGPAGSGDVDGDGHVDLLLPLAHASAQGASRGGGLYWIAQGGFGGIREPALLAPIAAVSVTVTPLDAQDGAEVIAMNRRNALAQLPSEAWIFGGGGAPARRASVPAGLAGVAVDTADLDRDGHVDVVSLGRDRVGIAFGDGQGAFPRTHAFTLEGAREIALGDVDGDGGVDLAVLADGLRWIPAGPLATMEPHLVEGAPSALRGVAIVDADADGKLDFVGWDHPSLVVLRQGEEVTFTAAPSLTLSGPFGPRRHVLADLDADGAVDDLALVGTTGEGAPVELMIVLDAVGRGDIAAADESTPLPDAPLMLSATLPAG